MKQVILHGPAVTSSRKKLLDLKQKFDPNNVVVFDSSTGSEQIIASLQTLYMFGEERLVVVENPQDDLFLNLPSTAYNLPATLVVWFDHEIKKLPDKKDIEILFFPEAKEISVFPFLDILANKNPEALLELRKLKKGGFDSQYIITMIFYLLRSLIYIPKTSPEFVKRKVSKQRENFPQDTVRELYKYVIETDFKIKQGLIEPEHAEFLLVSKFCHLV